MPASIMPFTLGAYCSPYNAKFSSCVCAASTSMIILWFEITSSMFMSGSVIGVMLAPAALKDPTNVSILFLVEDTALSK